MRAAITRRQFLNTCAAGAASLTALPLLNVTAPAVGATTKTAVPKLLLDGLKSDDLIIGADAARLLGDMGSREAIGPLVDYVTAWGYYAKTAGLDALGRLGDAGVCPVLRKVFDQPNVDDDSRWWYGYIAVRVSAALSLLMLGDDSRAGYMLEDEISQKKLKPTDRALFDWFAPAILRLPDTLAAARRLKRQITVAKLTAETRDSHRFIHRCDALSLLGTDDAIAVLVAYLRHSSRYVRGRAALGLLRVSQRADHVDRVVTVALTDPTDFARVKACEALAGYGREFYGRQIARMLTTGIPDPFDRAASIESLGMIGGTEHLKLIIKAAAADDPYLRLCAVEALERIGTTAAIDAVRERTKDGDMRVRMQVAKCLATSREGARL